jgi:hypothetical protein
VIRQLLRCARLFRQGKEARAEAIEELEDRPRRLWGTKIHSALRTDGNHLNKSMRPAGGEHNPAACGQAIEARIPVDLQDTAEAAEMGGRSLSLAVWAVEVDGLGRARPLWGAKSQSGRSCS